MQLKLRRNPEATFMYLLPLCFICILTLINATTQGDHPDKTSKSSSISSEPSMPRTSVGLNGIPSPHGPNLELRLSAAPRKLLNYTSSSVSTLTWPAPRQWWFVGSGIAIMQEKLWSKTEWRSFSTWLSGGRFPPIRTVENSAVCTSNNNDPWVLHLHSDILWS
ncbi:hypothetical protein CPB83DRAFT_104051 [Crepidotus variabilis]|uniref:Uncharacterized protein n=1 Tax=Crepidotus variabilis TaxID=179855 RepID=A0A9P6EKF7_9AGAR|nr:hypothetical protein CPB83DRAFT_104051 [Crepidotus variabilis]